jgi:hypothetical protein
MTDRADSDFHEEIDRQKAGEWIRAALARMATIRAEKVLDLNEQSRRKAKEANAGRRSRPDWRKNGKSAERLKQRAARTEPGTTATNVARTFGDSAELVNVGSGLPVRAGPDFD